MNNIGQGIFGPPTVGSSADLFFQTSAAGSFNSSDPTGSDRSFGGSPMANFGWHLNGQATVPETGGTALLLLLALGGLGTAARFRRQRA